MKAEGLTGNEDLKGFDSMVAVPSKVINQQLVSFFREREISESNEKGKISSRIKTPKLEMDFRQGKEQGKLILYINFINGTMYKSNNECKFESIRLSFISDVDKLKIGKNEILQSTFVTDKAKQYLNDFDENIFDIIHFFVALKKTVTLKNFWSVEGCPSDFVDLLVNLTALIFEKYDPQIGPFSLGFVPVIKESVQPAGDIPSLMPTSLNYSLTKNLQNPDWSTFNYLIMTGKRPAPNPIKNIDLQLINKDKLHGRYMVSEDIFIFNCLSNLIRGAFGINSSFERLGTEIKGRVDAGDENTDSYQEFVRWITDDQCESRAWLLYPASDIKIIKGCLPLTIEFSLRSYIIRRFRFEDFKKGIGNQFDEKFQLEFTSKWEMIVVNHKLYLKGQVLQAEPECYKYDINGHKVKITMSGEYRKCLDWGWQKLCRKINIERYLNMGQVIFPFEGAFSERDLQINGEKNHNLQADLTYEE